jgi:phosphocarrier protein HPr
MMQQEVIVSNSFGIHARPASLIAQTASRFKADVRLEKDGASANAASIMNVMMLAAAYKSTVVIKANGPEEKQAIEALVELFNSKFHEE